MELSELEKQKKSTLKKFIVFFLKIIFLYISENAML